MDEDVLEVRNVSNVCRLCLSMDEPRSSVFDVHEQEESAVPLVAKIRACLSIQISTTDKVSILICTTCMKSVDQWYSYKESCLRSQDKLQEWLTNQTQSKPMIVTIKDEPMDFNYEDDVEIVSEENPNNFELSDPPTQTVENNETNNEQVQEIMDDDDNNASDANEQEEPAEIIPSAVEETDKDEDQTDQEDCAPLCPIKSEPQDDYDTDCTIEVESMNDSELLLNPMAVATKEDTIAEADSTQKSNAASAVAKKKLRRGPHTHFRGTRVFKQKCVHCQIFLHSKYSYMKHMNRFHDKDNGAENSDSMLQNDEEEMVEDLEDELVSMEKDSPLTQVQQEIISQLKTFSCYSCEQTFNDRRSTLSHIRQHLPDLRPYTCVACLTEFPDRSMYQLHCGASFECAMKIALVVPKHGNERYFTCNMCLRSLQGRKELLSHLSKHSDKQYEEMMAPARLPPKLKPMAPLPLSKNDNTDTPTQTVSGPYKNGDPAHNHVCDLCGMIYRYRPNMIKHRQLCLRLQPELRTSYKCAYCSMTFLVFKKFHSHVTVDHKKKDFVCAVCNAKFRSPSDYLTHHGKHRTSHSSQIQNDDGKTSQNAQTPVKEHNSYDVDSNQVTTKLGGHRYICALCNLQFATRTELTEHRNFHLKVKIYSCAICRSMFSSAGALEIHMKDHGIEDPSERNANISCVEYGNLDEDARIEDSINASAVSDPDPQNYECNQCGKVLSSYANLRRHATIAHRNAKTYDCTECSKVFTRKELYEQHMQFAHKSSKTMYQCTQCPKSFVFQSNFNYHYRTAHLEKSQNGYACDICGKVFVEEASLKIHKGWHNRANSRLSTRFILGQEKAPNDTVKDSVTTESNGNSERPARARKSFPSPQLQSPTKSSDDFQCQVCSDKFNDVTELRSHLWDVHCAKSKAEKSFSNDELQCELCMNIFPNRETLNSHMRWHKANPILNDIRKTFPCDVCGKSYSSKKVLWKHKRLHKATVVTSYKFHSLARKQMAGQFLCAICRKTFSSSQSLQRHKISFHSESQNQQHTQQMHNSTRKLSEEESRPKRPKLEIDDNPPKLPPFAMDFAGSRRKPVMCHLCKKMFPNMSVLYKHKQTAHKSRIGKDGVPECRPISTQDGKFSCNVCSKEFPGLSNLRQHFTIKHKKTSEYQCNVSSCDLVFSTSDSLKDHEQTHTNIMFSCKLCNRHVFNKESMIEHIINVHNTVYQPDSKTFHREIDLNTYMVKGATGATCPACNVKYPNFRAMKIHYVKVHENTD